MIEKLKTGMSKDAYARSTALALGIVFLGFLAMFLGWNGAANIDFVSGQIPYLISGGAIGLAMVLVGLSMTFVQNSRREHAVLSKRLEDLVETLTLSNDVGAAGGSVIRAPKGSVVAGASSYHSPDCRLAQGRGDAEVISIDEAEDRGLKPCRICH